MVEMGQNVWCGTADGRVVAIEPRSCVSVWEVSVSKFRVEAITTTPGHESDALVSARLNPAQQGAATEHSARALFAAVLRVRGPTRRDARVAANDRHRRAILDRAAGQARQLQRQHASAAKDPCVGQALVDASRCAAARDVSRRHVSSACRGPEPLRWQRERRLCSELPPVPCVPVSNRLTRVWSGAYVIRSSGAEPFAVGPYVQLRLSAQCEAN